MGSEEVDFELAKTLFTQFLEQKGQKKTNERFAVLREIFESKGHLDVDALHVSMIKKKHRISKATLYNTMGLLIECNLVERHQFGTGGARYEKSFTKRQHDHLILTDTGEILEFCDPRIQNIKKTIEEIFGVKVSKHSLYFYATCNPTSKKSETD
ncbi:MAG: transcriptional repressor [Bacteroidota bacterium]